MHLRKVYGKQMLLCKNTCTGSVDHSNSRRNRKAKKIIDQTGTG